MNYYEEKLVEPNVLELFKRCCKLENNQKIDILKMLKSTPAYLKDNIYSEKDLKEAANLIEKCLQWIP
jgi:hypothetical protein